MSQPTYACSYATNCGKLNGYLVEILRSITQRAEQEIKYVMPSYIHLQRARPIR